MKLEFTCTACRRPGIFADALKSFTEHLHGIFWQHTTLYLNIDPAPAAGDADGVRAAAEAVFGSVVVNAPAIANFAAAVKWCWQQPQGEVFFGLEDDWILTRDVNFGDMLQLLLSDDHVSLVNLRAYGHNDDRLCLAPGLWRTAHARQIADRLRLDANPERQLRPVSKTNPLGGLHKGFIGRQYPSQRVLRDIGRAWMFANDMKRQGGREFLQWRQL